jgi:hypothetical protein
MGEFFTKAKGYSKAEVKAAIKRLHELLKKKAKWNQKADQKHFNFEQNGGDTTEELQADLAWHVRAWGQWVLDRARRELAQYYPTYADFEPLKKDQIAYEHQPMRLVPLTDDGTPDIDSLNAEFTMDYLADKRNPRWVVKPTVVYLWARTVPCKNCRATLPLLKTRWLCKKDRKRVLLTMEPNPERTGVVFGVETSVPPKGGNAAQRREHDKRIGVGTMSRAGSKCPCCGTIMTMEDLRLCNQSHEGGFVTTAVILDAPQGKEYRSPTGLELEMADRAFAGLDEAFASVPYGIPVERIPRDGAGASYGFPIVAHGIREWRRLFTPRQLLCLGTFLESSRKARERMQDDGVPGPIVDALLGYLYAAFSRLEDRNSALCTWQLNAEKIGCLGRGFKWNSSGRFCVSLPLGV